MFASLGTGHIGIKASLDEAMALTRRHGFEGLDFDLAEVGRWVGEHGVAELRARFADLGLKPGAYNLPFRPVGDEADWKSGLERLAGLAPVAAELGARRTIMWIIPSSDSLDYDENFAFHVARFSPIAGLLDQHGIRLGLEFIGPKTSRKGKHEFIHSAAGMLELCRAIGPNVGLLLDSWHWYTSGGTLADLADLTNDQIVHVHINDAPAGVARDDQIDNQRRLPGTTGVIDIEGFLRSLVRASYDGPVTAEPFDKSVSELPAEQAAERTARAVFDVLARAKA
jgi:sugar phosphate isomerase/epimerase